MRIQPPTSPFDVVGVDVARYGEPQHELSASATDCLYGPPQHEQDVEDPDWLISVASRKFSAASMTPVETSEPEPEPEPTEERERTVLRL
ncbi:hypothetical protein [Halohasta litorea]|uniref:Uncharacterized protein n=1 Tax=Halohasta litorea TaxID=869891 RepID=A0ABD6D3W5_9EURY|nr:hypothetical protein [Halohasta litorea]MEA1930409.1 hypothetical protein [Euryarchaeota archaeon]